MLQKSKSKKVWQLKYLVLIPMVLSMLFYTSCEKEESIITEKQMSIEEQVRELEAALESSDEELSPELRKQIFSLAVKTSNKKYNTDKKFDASKIDQGEDIPFTVIPVKPMFKDCEGLAQELQFECFKEKIDNHVRATFKYPLEAQNNGIQGRVYINFRINIDGSVTILNSRAPAASLDLEARRIIEALPTFLPGKDQNGNLHPVTFAYPLDYAAHRVSDTAGPSVWNWPGRCQYTTDDHRRSHWRLFLECADHPILFCTWVSPRTDRRIFA